MQRKVALRKLRRPCIVCNGTIYKGDIYYKYREVFEEDREVFAIERVYCARCEYKNEEHERRFERYKPNCKHPLIEEVWSYIPGEAVCSQIMTLALYAAHGSKGNRKDGKQMKTEMKKEDFRTRLEPFASLLSKLHSDVREILLTKPDEELRQLIEDTKQCTTTNCGWRTYDVREIVLREAQFILDSRPKEVNP